MLARTNTSGKLDISKINVAVLIRAKLFVKMLPSEFKLIYPFVEKNVTNWNLSAFLHTRKADF